LKKLKNFYLIIKGVKSWKRQEYKKLFLTVVIVLAERQRN